MGAAASDWAFEQSAARGADRNVLLALADWADGEGLCFGSLQRIAKRAGIHRRTAMRALVRLEAAGLVKRIHHRVNRSRRQAELPGMETSHIEHLKNTFLLSLGRPAELLDQLQAAVEAGELWPATQRHPAAGGRGKLPLPGRGGLPLPVGAGCPQGRGKLPLPPHEEDLEPDGTGQRTRRQHVRSRRTRIAELRAWLKRRGILYGHYGGHVYELRLAPDGQAVCCVDLADGQRRQIDREYEIESLGRISEEMEAS